MFLKSVAAASAVAAAPAAFASTTASRDSENGLLPQAPTLTWNKAPCRLCGIGCGLLIGVQSGRAVAVKGDPASTVGGGLACAKGYYAVQAMYGLERLNRASIRRGATAAPAPIGEALDVVARQLKSTLDQHGPGAIAMYGGAAHWTLPDAYVASKLFKGALGSNNVENSARLSSAASSGALRGAFGLDASPGSYDDIDHADVIVLWDANVAESDPVLFSRMLARRSNNAAVRIIDVSSRTTRTSYAADQTVLHPPHGTRAIATAIAQDLIARNLVDRRFLDRYVAVKRGRTGRGYGLTDDALLTDDATAATFEEYAESVKDTNPDRVQKLTGVPASTIQWLASLYGDRAKKVLSIWGANVSQHARGLEAATALLNVHLLVGRVGSPGNTAFSLSGQGGGGAILDAGTFAHSLPRGSVTNEADRQRAATIWGVPAARISATPGKSTVALFRAIERGSIKFLWIQATNPMVSLPNVDRFRKAVQQSGCFVVVSDVYRTATTDLAHVVLPSALWSEREGVVDNDEHRLQQFDLMVAAPGDAMSDAWQMIEVAKRLGHGKLFPSERRGHVEQLWEEYRRFYDEPRSTLPTYQSLRLTTGTQWPVSDRQPVQRRYNTSHDPLAKKARGAFDFYGHADGRAWLWIRPDEAGAETTSAAFPLWLTSGPVLEQSGTGTLTQHIPTLHRAIPKAYVEFHKDDAKRLGIHDRDLVKVVSKRGSIALEARIDYRSQPQRGQIFVPAFDAEQPVARLMSDAFCPVTGQPDVVQCAVQVERVSAAGPK
jgi:nitrate reductase NapA